MRESSTFEPAHLTGSRDAYGRELNDQGFAEIDEERLEHAVREFLLAIGENPDREGLKETPARVARATEELLSGMWEEPKAHLRKQFEAPDSDELVVVRDIPFESFCEHHILPFRGTAAVVYLPKHGRICGLSKLGRLVQGYAHRLQVQERLTAQIADALMEELDSDGALVILSAEHSCMTMRGIKSTGSLTVTEAARGVLADDRELRREARELAGAGRSSR